MKLVWPFIDPKTKEKIIYNEEMRNHVPAEQLRVSHGGDLEFEYEHDVYWPSFVRLAEERRRLQHERWVKGGKMIGEFEAYLRGGQEESLRSTMKAGEDQINEKVADMSLGGEQEKRVAVSDGEKASEKIETAVAAN